MDDKESWRQFLRSRRALYGLAVALLLTVASSAAHVALQAKPEPGARCTTDSECVQLCPAEDDDCDGGPEPVKLVRV